MKFKCPKCGKVFMRDLRHRYERRRLTKRGYRSMCVHAGRVTYCKQVSRRAVVTPIIVALVLLAFPAWGEDIDLKAIAIIESGNNPSAFNPKANAVGLYQITLPAVRDWNSAHIRDGYSLEDMYNVKAARRVADWYMNERIPRYLAFYGIPDSVEHRIMAWNWGIGKLRRWYEGEIIDVPEETQRYIRKYKTLTGRR